jgi:hypothetical protein
LQKLRRHEMTVAHGESGSDGLLRPVEEDEHDSVAPPANDVAIRPP